jgi:hypothetical protein
LALADKSASIASGHLSPLVMLLLLLQFVVVDSLVVIPGRTVSNGFTQPPHHALPTILPEGLPRGVRSLNAMRVRVYVSSSRSRPSSWYPDYEYQE